ncbi:hypothetical protein DFH09DRAFT_1276204 [Mycena vulgaris]|nr:hypothetical protein DFH09DRAFT_1276204 [Mycena vulgaris]
MGSHADEGRCAQSRAESSAFLSPERWRDTPVNGTAEQDEHCACADLLPERGQKVVEEKRKRRATQIDIAKYFSSVSRLPLRVVYSESDKKPGEVATQRLIFYLLLFLFDVFPVCALGFATQMAGARPGRRVEEACERAGGGAEREKEAPECGAKRTVPGLRGGRGRCRCDAEGRGVAVSAKSTLGYWEELKFFQNLQVLGGLDCQNLRSAA